MLQVTNIKYLGDYKYFVSFNNGKSGVADFRRLAFEEPNAVFARFSDESFVSQGHLEHGTLLWPGEIDVAPEFVYYTVLSNEPELHDTFVKWGYC